MRHLNTWALCSLKVTLPAGLLLFAAGPPASRAATIYSVQSLAALGPGIAQPSAINSSGTAVGYMTTSNGSLSAVTFANGQTTTLGTDAIAVGVNDSGLVVGASYRGIDLSVAEWANGKLTTLDIPGYATSVNNAGQVAGGYITPARELHAFVWNHGVLNDLGTLGGGWSSAYGVNSSGQVTGTSLTNSFTFDAFFDNGKGMSDLGTLGGRNSYGMAINNSGMVVGNSQTGSGQTHGFAWNGSGMTDLGTLGGSQSYAFGVNNTSTIVGSSFITGNQAEHGFVFANGVITDLNALLPLDSGWVIDAAYAINNAGDILAEGTLHDQLYAVELAPGAPGGGEVAPEPSTLLFAGLGLLGLGAWSRRFIR
ncbi:MAG: PEP-CTERM sorting domain-containing protein [Acidobacteriaceae bacterium]|nr:PEP-CTERM sorting domain-containing protein [Acidobacteriaceae bacterium]